MKKILYVIIYIFFIRKVFFKSSFRLSGSGSAVTSLNFSTVLDERGKNAGGDG